LLFAIRYFGYEKAVNGEYTMSLRDVCALIISYNPSPEIFGKLLESLDGQCDVLVVDNGSSVDVQKILGERGAFIALGENLGIAQAQNIGLEYLRQSGKYKYVLFLDHDSRLSADFIKKMLSIYEEIKKVHRIAVLGPVLFDSREKFYYSFHRIDGLFYKKVDPVSLTGDYYESSSVNSSGSFCSLDVFDAVGLLDNELFIDHVETEWCFRAISKGFSVYNTNKVELEHRMGDDVLVLNFFWRSVFMPYRSPGRHEYLFRNSVLLIKRGYIPLVWKVFCVVKLLITFAIFGLFSKERGKQMKSMVRGLSDGLLNRKGKIIL